MKKPSTISLAAVAAATILAFGALAPTRASAAPPTPPARMYIADINPVQDGVRVTLNWQGFKLGWSRTGATALAGFTIAEYQQLTRKPWPYDRRSRSSVAREIQAHALAAFTPFWGQAFPVNIGFAESYWD